VAALALLLSPAVAAAQARVVDDEGWCRDHGSDDRAHHCEVREVAVSGAGLIEVDARPNGGIAVQGWDRPEARLRVKIHATADTEAEARDVASAVRVETAGAVRAAGPARSRGRSWYASFRLDVPRTARLRLQADNGGLHLEEFGGVAELHTVNGGIHVEGGAGHLQGETVNGGLHLSLTGSGWDGEGVALRTTNGGLHLQVPDGYDARLEASTVNGGIHSDLPPTTRGRHTGGRIEADLGSGGALIRVQTTNGGLHVSVGGKGRVRRTGRERSRS
jgi:hypothetical protein